MPLSRRILTTVRLACRAGCLLAASLTAAASAQPEAAGQPPLRDLSRTSPNDLGLKVDEKLGSPLPLELTFTNGDGERHRLGEYFAHTDASGNKVPGKPAIIALVYYRCPVVCSTLLSTINDGLREVNTLNAGKDFNVLTFTFDPTDDKFAAQSRKKSMLLGYGRGDAPETAAGWQFFLHEEGSTRQLANSLGFPYREVGNGQDFLHPVVFFMVTPDGKIARYIYGFGHTAFQLRMAILEAGEGTITPSLKDQFLTFCYMYNPEMGKYTLSAIRVMQIGGVITLVGLVGLIGILLIGERLRARRARATLAVAGPTISSPALADSTLRNPTGESRP